MLQGLTTTLEGFGKLPQSSKTLCRFVKCDFTNKTKAKISIQDLEVIQ